MAWRATKGLTIHKVDWCNKDLEDQADTPISTLQQKEGRMLDT
jgi:hypothetical protein